MSKTLKDFLLREGLIVTLAQGRRLVMSGRVKVNNLPINRLDFVIKTGDCIEVFNKVIKTIDISTWSD